jgi:hypothetical protein
MILDNSRFLTSHLSAFREWQFGGGGVGGNNQIILSCLKHAAVFCWNGLSLVNAACQACGLGSIPGPGQTYVLCGKVALFCNPASEGTFSSTAIEIKKWVWKIAVAQAKVSHILRPGKASEKTPKGVIPPSLCEISQNASWKKMGCWFSRVLVWTSVVVDGRDYQTIIDLSCIVSQKRIKLNWTIE